MPSHPTVVAIEPYPLQLPKIANVLFQQLDMDVICFYSVIAFKLNRYEEKDIQILLVDDSSASLELVQNLRNASRIFPVIMCVDGDEAFERTRIHTKDMSTLWLYKRDSEGFLSLVQLMRDILHHLVH